MWIDIVIAIILLFCIIKGYRNGFTKTVIGTVGWFASVILAYLFSSPISEYISEKTSIYENLTVKLQERFADQGATALQDIVKAMPQTIQDYFYKGLNSVSVDIAGSITDIALRIASFLIIVLVIKIVSRVLISLFSKKKQDGVIGTMDGILGALTGLITGLVISYLILALLVPLGVSFGGDFLSTSIQKSFAAKYLYDYNILLMIINRLM